MFRRKQKDHTVSWPSNCIHAAFSGPRQCGKLWALMNSIKRSLEPGHAVLLAVSTMTKQQALNVLSLPMFAELEVQELDTRGNIVEFRLSMKSTSYNTRRGN